MSRVLQYIPEAQGEEYINLERITEQMSDDQLHIFSISYRERRRDPQNILLLTLLSFLGFSGFQRFYVGQIGMGILYLLTSGLCFIGTIIDLINHKDIAREYNASVALDIAKMV